jgi:hypothetical protein
MISRDALKKLVLSAVWLSVNILKREEETETNRDFLRSTIQK